MTPTKSSTQETENSTQQPTDTRKGTCNPYHAKPQSGWRRIADNIDWSQVILDLLLIVIGIRLAYIYSGQLDQMIESNRISRESLESVQRAFVNFTGPILDRQNILNPTSSGRVVLIKGILENDGTTQAEDVVTVLSSGMLGDEPTEDQFFRGTSAQAKSLITIAPKGHRDTGIVRWKEADILGDTLSNPKTPPPTSRYLFVWGWVAYHDVFKNTKMHIAEYCKGLSQVYVPTDKNAGPQLTFTDCRHHNCNDDHCEDYQSIVAEANKSIK
jgi:hypothetical protein